MSDFLKPEDYKEPTCIFCTDFYSNEKQIKPIDISRMIEKLDDFLGRDDYDAARRHLEYWLGEAEAGNDLRGALAVKNELMGLFRKLGEEKSAKLCAKEALSIIDRLELCDSVTGATSYINAATVYKAFGDAEKAIPLYEKARIIYEKLLSPVDSRLGGLYNNTALALADMKRYKEARELLEKAISIMENTENGEPEAAISYLNLANISEAEKGIEDGANEITEYIEKAQALLNTDGLVRNGNYAFVCEKCASSFDYYGYFAFADELKKRAREIYERT